MKTVCLYGMLAIGALGILPAAYARDVVVPAGTLLQCTLNEPNFSSSTVNVGDPFLCYPRTMQQFGQTVFPRGTYLVGHLENAKDPGHFVGKGYLQLTIDRVGLPATDLPLSAKVIAVAKYRVDREGKVIGHGHATRDTVEWMLPPLWPWKVMTLPARGPRPTLKGEVRLTLRVMDDLTVPQTAYVSPPVSSPALTLPPATPGWRRFGEPSAYRAPSGVNSNATMATVSYIPSRDETQEANAATNVANATTMNVALDDRPSEQTSRMAWPENVTLFALTDGTVFPATQYYRNHDSLSYAFSDGSQGAVLLNSIDWSTTTRLNSARNVRVTLRSAPALDQP